MRIIADFREKRSGVPSLIAEKGVTVDFANLVSGDYYLENHVLFERKTAEDFVQSLIAGRLFAQAEGLKRSWIRHCLVVEGNPYKTLHRISRSAIRGALVSLAVAWQLPVLFSAGKQDTADILLAAMHQENKKTREVSGKNAGVKGKGNLRLAFLQGLPGAGPGTAKALMDRFGTIRGLVDATMEELLSVGGVGTVRAARIYEFLNRT
ncbi:MAG: hypothetical protein JXA03_08530 [Bacteroidales bacterium]|nr:hypothetical protein [Bacteroidales bacterium]